MKKTLGRWCRPTYSQSKKRSDNLSRAAAAEAPLAVMPVQRLANRGRGQLQLWSVCFFSNEANLPTRIGLLDVIRAELKKVPYKQKCQVVSSRLELSPKRKPLAKARALFYKGLEEVKGGKSKIQFVHGKIQISFFVRSATAAKYTPEGEDLAG